MRTEDKIERELRESPGLTALELGRRIRVSAGTCRSYLYQMVRDGRVERRQEDTVPSPRGSGAARWYWLANPLGPAEPADQMLCDSCITELYRDRLRYVAAMTDELTKRDWSRRMESDHEELAWLNCERCGKPLFPGD